MLYTQKLTTISKDSQGVYNLHVELDTEFDHISHPLNPELKYCLNLTVQCREIHHKVGKIFAHPDIVLEARHPVFKRDFAAWDYLESLGHDLACFDAGTADKQNDFPLLIVNVYAYFAIAEIGRIFQGDYQDFIKKQLKHPGKHSSLKMTRRLMAVTQKGRNYHEYIDTPWGVIIDGNAYRVALSIIDTCAIHGITSYSDFCKNSGVELAYKDVLSTDDKGRMRKIYHERPEDFDNYARGDLYNYDALVGNANNFLAIYQSLGLEDYYTPPKLTIGSTVARMLESGIHKLFGKGYKRADIINQFCQYGSADRLKRENTTACLLAKVDGGRCRNNRPIETFHEGVLCDIDISGCYGNGLRQQIYPLGVPCILDYPRGYDCNKYLTLRQFRKKYESDFIPGLWTARVSLKQGYQLKYQQDFLMSWLPPNDIYNMVTDSESEATDQWWEIDNVGLIKIFKNEVHNAVITHDFLQWLDNIATPRQRKELLDNLLVFSASWYPKSLRVDSIDKLLEAHNNYEPKNTTEIKSEGKKRLKVAIQDMCHSWYGLNLGDLLIDNLLNKRKEYPKKTPFNNLYKLCTNTVYGDMVSPYFKVGNVVVGNNITARARALAWYMEKGFNGWQTITDGCTFDITRVPVATKNTRLTGENTVALYTQSEKRYIQYKNLIIKGSDSTGNPNSRFTKSEDLFNNFYRVDTKGETVIDTDTNKQYSEIAWKHLQECFPNVDVLHAVTTDLEGYKRVGQFEFEIKGLYRKGTFHGSANYSLTYEETKVAMRSYSKKPKSIVTKNDELEYEPEKQLPAKEFLQSLETPNQVPRGKVFIDERILKLNDYRNHPDTYFESRVLPGNTIYRPRILREFSPSQFTFNTLAQYKSWKSEYERLIRKYGQSYEMFFLNDDGTLDFQTMIESIELAIREGKKRFSQVKELASRHAHRYYQNHDELEILKEIKLKIQDLYKG